MTSSGDLLDPGIKPSSPCPALAKGCLPLASPGLNFPLWAFFVVFSFLFIPNSRTKRINNAIPSLDRTWNSKFQEATMFVLTGVTFELKAIKQEKTRQFFLKFLAKKIWESFSINNEELFGSQWLVKQMIKAFSGQIV